MLSSSTQQTTATEHASSLPGAVCKSEKEEEVTLRGSQLVIESVSPKPQRPVDAADLSLSPWSIEKPPLRPDTPAEIDENIDPVDEVTSRFHPITACGNPLWPRKV